MLPDLIKAVIAKDSVSRPDRCHNSRARHPPESLSLSADTSRLASNNSTREIVRPTRSAFARRTILKVSVCRACTSLRPSLVSSRSRSLTRTLSRNSTILRPRSFSFAFFGNVFNVRLFPTTSVLSCPNVDADRPGHPCRTCYPQPLGREWSITPEGNNRPGTTETYIGYSIEHDCMAMEVPKYEDRKRQVWILAKHHR